jgi:hypothetical protein
MTRPGARELVACPGPVQVVRALVIGRKGVCCLGPVMQPRRLLATLNEAKCLVSPSRRSSRVSTSNNISRLGLDPKADPPPPRHNTFGGRRLLLAGSQPRGPSRVVGFPLVGFGAKVASGSSDSTMAISSPGSRSEARDGRR